MQNEKNTIPSEQQTGHMPKLSPLEQARRVVRTAQVVTKSRAFPVLLSFDQVKTQARGQWQRIFELLRPGVTESDPHYDYGTCPVCNKKWKFKFFKDFNDTGTCICYKCHENGGDGIATVAWLLDCSPNEARTLLSDLLQTDAMK